MIMSAKNKLKNPDKYKDVYITNDYARAIQMHGKKNSNQSDVQGQRKRFEGKSSK